LLSYDHYHFFKSDRDGEQYFENLELVREAALKANIPFINTIQANTSLVTWRVPNPQELRFLVFTTILYGGRGISYFTYWTQSQFNGLYQDGHPGPLMPAVVTLNHEMKNFGLILMTLHSLAVYHTAPLPLRAHAVPASSPVQIFGSGSFVLGLFGDDNRDGTTVSDNPIVFMVLNRNYHVPSQATVSVTSPWHYLQELDRSTGRWMNEVPLDKGGFIKVTLALGDGKLFKFAR